MYNSDYINPRIFARTDEELTVVLRNEDQSATPNQQHALFLSYFYAAMIPMILSQLRYMPPPLNVERLDYNPTTLPLPLSISTGGAQQHVTPPPGFTLQGNQRFGLGAWLALVATYIGMNALLLAYFQLKSQSKTDYPFQTHFVFVILSIAGFFMTLFTSGILVYTEFSPVYDLILKSVFCFSLILTPLTILLTFFIPENFNWTGYLIVFALFVAILKFNFHSLKRILAARRSNNLG